MPTQAPPDYGYPPPAGPYPPGRPPTGRPPKQGDAARRAKLIDYGLKGLGLLGVALVSGFLWFLIRNNPAPTGPSTAAPPTQQVGIYQFQPYQPAATETDCVGHSTNVVKTFLQQHTCVSLTRSLYTTNLVNGQKVITSVAVVRMDGAVMAKALQKVSDGNGTGHVKDLVEDGVVIPGGPNSLQDGGYFSAVRGARVVIVETEFVDGNLDNQSSLTTSNRALRAVSQDAAKQGIGLG
jgi:hypothetical protein